MTSNQNITTANQTRPAGELLELEIAGVKVNFRWAPAGKFMMGSPEDEPERRSIETRHNVTLTQGFWIAETPTTQELWQAVMGNNPSEFKGSNQLPVENVSWNDCHDFVEKLNHNFGNALPSGFQYAIPTEAQWEYACRAGTTTPFSFGSTLNGDKANCRGNVPYGTTEVGQRQEHTSPVKSYAPNPWGLYDMHGNVFEWCADWYEPSRYSGYVWVTDPTGPLHGSNHVLRGGSWSRCAGSCRSAYRYSGEYLGNGYSLPTGCVGFRLILVPKLAQPLDVVTQRESLNGDETETSREPGALLELEIAGVKVNFRWAPAGTFLMGCPESEKKRGGGEAQHEVTLTHGFWIAETPTTREFWHAVMGNHNSWHQSYNQHPVVMIRRNECQLFVNKLNRHYRTALPNGYVYALPTESQWEYACRAGTTTPFNFGSRLNGDKANCDGRCPYGTVMEGTFLMGTTPVRKYAPNAWGVYDMHGNVHELCSNGIRRGGGWRSAAWNCRSASLNPFYPEFRDCDCGFRLAIVPQPLKPIEAVAHGKYPNAYESETSREPGALLELLIAGVKVNFHWAPAGTFLMGSPENEEDRREDETQHEVTLSQGFWIAETPTTQELWQAVMGRRSKSFYPVQMIHWNACQWFVKMLNRSFRTALPCGFKCALPTEAQWEYACRAGTTTPFYFGSTLNDYKTKWCTPSSGRFGVPNAWGLYFMHWSVWEWCADWYGKDYYTSSDSRKDPTGPDGSDAVLRGGAYRVVRGAHGDCHVGRSGCPWRSSDAEDCRSASREYCWPGYRDVFSGFRFVLVPSK